MTPFRPMIPLAALLALRLCPSASGEPLASPPPVWKSLASVQRALGAARYEWDGDALSFSNQSHRLRFFAGRRKLDVDGTAVWLNAAPDGSVAAGDWRLASPDLDLLLLSVLPTEEAEPRPLRVLLDPGHGGEDDGACSASPAVNEKDLNLALALQVGAYLARAGLRVTYTRTNDTSVALDERTRLARRSGADLFVSVHANHAANTNANGVETYVLPLSGFPGTADGSPARGSQPGNRNDFHNTLLGYAIHSRLATLGSAPDRGLKRQAFYVLREARCPAVLLEFGFLSHPEEVRRLLDPAWQSACASNIAEGVTAYARKLGPLESALAERKARADDAAALRRARLAAARTAPPPPAAEEPPLHGPPAPAPAAAAASAAAATNAAPLTLTTLFDFYPMRTTD